MSHRHRLFLTCLLAAYAATAHADPILSSWFTKNSAVYARVVQTTTTSTGTKNTTPVTAWPTAGITNNNNGGAAQTVPVYADVQQVRHTATDVYISSSGLASYTMGPWLTASGGLFNFWPVSQNFTVKLPRTPATPVPTDKTRHGGGPIGLMVNGVVIYDLGDAFAFVQTASGPVTGSDSMGQTNVTHPWWRNALEVEVVTFDPGFAHQPGINGQYHYHAEPKALRYQLGDNMQATRHATTANNTFVYTEDTSNLHHSPILGWSFDGYPIYGPYGYTTAMNASSAVTRMRSGFVKRDGTNSTTNLAITGRVTLPKWAAIAEGFATLANYASQTLSNGDLVLANATLYGPATNYANGANTYSLGRYIGDFDYLGDRGQTQGPTGTFDLDQYNGRTCVTPEFPSGTYAYFVSLDAAGNPAFPYMLGKQYYGTKATGSGPGATVPTSGVTEYFNGGQNLVESWHSTPSITPGTGNLTLTWSSVEGGTYTVEASANLTTWSPVNTAVPAAVNTAAPPISADVITTTSIIETGAALPVNNTKRFYRVSRNP